MIFSPTLRGEEAKVARAGSGRSLSACRAECDCAFCPQSALLSRCSATGPGRDVPRTEPPRTRTCSSGYRHRLCRTARSGGADSAARRCPTRGTTRTPTARSASTVRSAATHTTELTRSRPTTDRRTRDRAARVSTAPSAAREPLRATAPATDLATASTSSPHFLTTAYTATASTGPTSRPTTTLTRCRWPPSAPACRVCSPTSLSGGAGWDAETGIQSLDPHPGRYHEIRKGIRPALDAVSVDRIGHCGATAFAGLKPVVVQDSVAKKICNFVFFT